MAKGKRKRTIAEYEREIEETANRLKKQKEAKKSARSSKVWLEFLDNLGIAVESKARQDFFEDVRQKISPPRVAVEREKQYIDYSLAGVVKEVTGSFRSVKTGRFVKRSYVVARSTFTERQLAEKRISLEKSGKFRDSETGRYISVKQIKEKD